MKKVYLTFLFLFGLISFNYLKAQDAQQPVNPNAPEIKFDKEEHDYGTIQKGGESNCVFSFTNTGKEPLILSNVRSSCGCTVPQWTKDPILPGKTGKIDVHYDSNRIGPISKQITVTSNAKTSTVVLRIKGNVIDSPAPVTPDKPANSNVAPSVK